MITRRLVRAGTAVAVAILGFALAASESQAAFVGSFGINGYATGTDTNDLKNATQFTNTFFTTNGDATGVFAPIAGLPPGSPAVFGPTTGGSTITLTPTQTSGFATSGFSFGNAVYGMFMQTAQAVFKSESFATDANGNLLYPTSITYYVVGSYSGGAVGAATPASVTITFTQNGGLGSSFSASGTLTIPAVVPEPASLTLLGLGLTGLGVLARRRRVTA